jgi:hypothetical protein
MNDPTENQKGTEAQFNQLHKAVTTELVNRVSMGESCSTADLKAAIEWLHKNNISGVAVEGNELDKLRKVIPMVDYEDIRKRVNG